MAGGRKGGGMIGTKVSIPDEHAFATPGEISSRDSTAKQNAPTGFSQPGPADNPGMNVATMDQSADNRSGNMKWSPGV